MSLLGKKWIIKDDSRTHGIVERVFKNRPAIKNEDLSEFYDPFLFSDMKKAVLKIKNAIEKKHRILIFGDYDVDGITGSAILFRALKNLGAEVSIRIPNREKDGYGLSDKFLQDFVSKNVKLLITVDCGISNKKQISDALSLGIETIITDHHTIPENFPDKAFAILHPKDPRANYPYKGLTGAGVALKLAHALILELSPGKENSALDPLLDLACMGTIADLGPLDGENRLIVKRGLKIMQKSSWVGVRKLIEISGIDPQQPLNTGSIGFKLGPRINAAGRISDPYIALSLLLQDCASEKVDLLGNFLENLNAKRQNMVQKAVLEAEEKIKDKEKSYMIIESSENWHVGILGLIAGYFQEKYFRPSIIMNETKEGFVGSARSPECFSIIDALTFCSNELSHFGGHSVAAGFSLEKKNLEKFKEKISDYARQKLKNTDLRPILKIDCTVCATELSLEIFDELENFAPFGIKNHRPSFLLKDTKPINLKRVGKDGNHLKFSVCSDFKTIDAIGFNMGKYAEQISAKEKIDIVFHLDKNTWKNSTSLQLQTLDIGLPDN